MSYAPTQPGISTGAVGAANMQALTLFDAEPYLPPPDVANDYSDSGGATAGEVIGPNHPSLTGQGSPHLVLLGLILGLVALGFLQKESAHITKNTIALNAFNFSFVILATMVGFVIMKVIFAKFPVPGVSQVVHAA